jgi:plastocyanin
VRYASILILLLAACDRAPDPGAGPEGGNEPDGVEPPSNEAAREGSASIRGRVLFDGEHRPSPITVTPECARLHPRPPLNERILRNEDGTLRNVLVYVKSGLSGRYPAPSEVVLIDQKGCVYLPHVAVAMVGQPVTYRSSDDFVHNVRIAAKRNPRSNFSMSRAGEERSVGPYRIPEIGIEVGCDVHSWMRMVLHVLRHPKYQVTGDGGAFAIDGLPDGAYTLAAWHGDLGEQTRQITLADGETLEGIEFRFTR